MSTDSRAQTLPEEGQTHLLVGKVAGGSTPGSTSRRFASTGNAVVIDLQCRRVLSDVSCANETER